MREHNYSSDDGWDSSEGLKIIDLHRHGLLATGQHPTEATVSIPVLKTETLSGFGIWFHLYGIASSGSFENKRIEANDECYKIHEYKMSPVLQSQSYYDQSITCIESAYKSYYKTSKSYQPGKLNCNEIHFRDAHVDTKSHVASSGSSYDGNYCVDNTLPLGLVTVGAESPCQQAVVMADNSVFLHEGDVLILDCIYKDGALNVKLLRHDAQLKNSRA